MSLNIEEMAAFCKRKGLLYPSAEIYGGLAGFFDFGPLGVEINNNIKQHWWKTFVQNREDVVGIDGSIITNRKVWEASGHAACFADLMLTTKKTKQKLRADHFLEEKLGINAEGITAQEVNRLVKEHKLMSDEGEHFEEVKPFNLMFETNVGPVRDKENSSFLRPETAQSIFANFNLVFENARAKLPFGIAQIGKMFRNEISPRDFLFRTREFEGMEIEFFVHPDKFNDCPYYDEIKDVKINVLTAGMQEKNTKEGKDLPLSTLVDTQLCSQWHGYWLALYYNWFTGLGIKGGNLRLREHTKDELSHYATACFDFEYKFPFGWKELQGNADRGQYDLTKHGEMSGKALSVYDEESKQKIVPYVASEPSQGVGRLFLACMFDAYNDDKERGNVVLKLHPKLVPVQVGVFPLVNKLKEKAHEVFSGLQGEFVCQFDKSGSIGRRYARADEIGVPLCVTVDFDSLEDKSVTVRERDSAKQIRVAIADLKSVVSRYYVGEEFLKLGSEVVVEKK
jgi:glycyl-tRNA synthetase